MSRRQRRNHTPVFKAKVNAPRQAHQQAIDRLLAPVGPHIGREPKPMTADYERAVAEHIIDLWEESGELLALIEMIPEVNFLLV